MVPVPVSMDMSESYQSYGMAFKALFFLFMGYERLVNSSDRFEGLRHTMDCVLQKPTATVAGKRRSHVPITPARNEETGIARMVECMVAADLPLKWVIATMGRRIGRPRPLRPHARRYSWIEVVRRPVRQERRLPERCTPSTRTRGVRSLEFDVIGNLDADISFGPKHFEFLLARLAQDPTLGVVGAAYTEDGWDSMQDSFEGAEVGARACSVVSAPNSHGHRRLFLASSRRIELDRRHHGAHEGQATRNFPEHRFASSHYGHCRARVAGRDV